MNQENKYISLYDFFGKAAGKETGLWVAQKAAEIGVPCQTRQVNNPKYTGEVNLYPEMFLKTLFRNVKK